MIEVDGLTKHQGSKAATSDLTFLSVGLFTFSLIRDRDVIFHVRGDGCANCRTAVVAHAWTLDRR